MDRNASLPTSIPVLNSQLPCSPVTQTSLDLALFLQSMETFRANRLLSVIESPPMNQSAAIEAIAEVENLTMKVMNTIVSSIRKVNKKRKKKLQVLKY